MKDTPKPDDEPNKPDNNSEHGEPKKPEEPKAWPNLVSEFYESKYATKSRGLR